MAIFLFSSVYVYRKWSYPVSTFKPIESRALNNACWKFNLKWSLLSTPSAKCHFNQMYCHCLFEPFFKTKSCDFHACFTHSQWNHTDIFPSRINVTEYGAIKVSVDLMSRSLATGSGGMQDFMLFHSQATVYFTKFNLCWAKVSIS